MKFGLIVRYYVIFKHATVVLGDWYVHTKGLCKGKNYNSFNVWTKILLIELLQTVWTVRIKYCIKHYQEMKKKIPDSSYH